ncbi:hypothetical protein EIP91_005162 [Steccherinum ochraceum]|uniref:NAD(P)-binding domain-containing protein n=1 Tax=Steccherinum ochraceum TaxID=92696 RepID=A0A4R0RDP8_9APHY|nr:hypothetical protein EIP91_005162 [Steccherinum ochraceum]
MTTPILIIGATGYIGGGVLALLLEHPSAKTFDITVLVRSPTKAKIFEEKFGLKTSVGSTDDVEKLAKLASEAHVVISAVDADDLPAMKAILSGLRERHAKVGDLPILIHTSGTGVLTTNDKGNVVGQKIYDDSKPESIASLPDEAPHRNVDLAIVEADKAGYLKSYIVLPSTIYGIATHALVKAGASNPYSIQIRALIKAALDRGVPGVVGKGVSVWPSVEINEVYQIFILLFDGIVNNDPAIGHGEDGFYFGINGEHSWYELSKEIGRVLKAKGRVQSDEPTTFSDEELVKYFGSLSNGHYYGTSSRGVANHSKAIGWKPVKTTKDMLASVTPEVETLL